MDPDCVEELCMRLVKCDILYCHLPLTLTQLRMMSNELVQFFALSPSSLEPFNTMTYVVYSSNNALSNFFISNTTVTRQQCDDFVISRVNGVPTPLQMQGVCSYIVTGAPTILSSSSFETTTLPLIWTILTLPRKSIPNLRLAASISGP